MFGSNGSSAPKNSWQQFSGSQNQRWSSSYDRAKARSRAMKDLFGGNSMSDDMTGASPTDEPAGAEADLQKQLQNEQRQRSRGAAVKNLFGFGG